MIKLYDNETAPSPRRTRIFLAEKDVPHENIQIDLRKGEQFSADFMKINPRCTVPALVIEDGDAICENIAIAQYIEDKFPTPSLMGSTSIERARVLEWNARCEFEGLAAVAEILRNTSKGMVDRALTGSRNIAQLPELAERGRERLGYFFEDLNTQLKDNDFVAGDNFSLADITAVITVDFSAWVKATPDENHKALWAWHGRIADRPSYKA